MQQRSCRATAAQREFGPPRLRRLRGHVRIHDHPGLNELRDQLKQVQQSMAAGGKDGKARGRARMTRQWSRLWPTSSACVNNWSNCKPSAASQGNRADSAVSRAQQGQQGQQDSRDKVASKVKVASRARVDSRAKPASRVVSRGRVASRGSRQPRRAV